MKTNIKIIIGVAIGILISVASCYVLAETLINSKDVGYEDNSNLAADNVQDAIDGTCSKIDTRLSDIEDKLYTFTRFSNTVSFTSQTTLSYTGASITVPANSYCGITANAIFGQSVPTALFLCNSSTHCDLVNVFIEGNNGLTAAGRSIFLTYDFFTTYETTYYFWASYSAVSINRVSYTGYCATKYK